MYQRMKPLSDGRASYLVIVTPKAYLETYYPPPLFLWGKYREIEQLPKAPLQVGGKLVKMPWRIPCRGGDLKLAPSAYRAYNR